MERRSEPSFNVGVGKSPSFSPSPPAQNASSMAFSDSQASHGFKVFAEEGVKRKRGRPRMYTAADGTPLLAAGSSSTDRLEAKKKKEKKNVGWGKKIQMKALGSSETGFTSHVIKVKIGEDVSAKIMSFSSQGARALCILSANGALSSVELHQPETSGGTVAYEGRYEILSLSGSSLPSESLGQTNRTGGLSVSLGGLDGHVIGGVVAGGLVAATPVQVVVGSFIAECGGSGGGRKEPLQPLIRSAGESAPEKPTLGGLPGPSSQISRDASSPSSPHNQSFNGDKHNGE